MKKYLAISILLSSMAFSADIELYTSAVIKLVKENKKLNKDVIKNQRDILVLKKIKSSSKDPYLKEIKTAKFNNKSNKEIQNISKIDYFISINR